MRTNYLQKQNGGDKMVYRKKTISNAVRQRPMTARIIKRGTTGKTRRFSAIPPMRAFKFLTGDVNWKDYGGTWYRSTGDHTYYTIEFINCEDATGGQIKNSDYLVIGNSFDLTLDDASSVSRAESALSVIGESLKTAKSELELLDAMGAYGGYDEEFQLYGNNANELLAEAKRRL